MKKLLITVTTAPGKPNLELPADTANSQIRQIVEKHFGMQDSGGWMMPHNYCGGFIPNTDRPLPMEVISQFAFTTRRGHNRVV